MNPLTMIAGKYIPLAKLAAVGLAIVLALIWWNRHNAAEQKVGYDRAAGEYAQKLTEAQAEARITTQAMFNAWEHAQNARIDTEKKLDAARAAASAAVVRLHDAANNIGISLSGATAETSRNAAVTAAGLLDECSAEYQRVAAAADGHRADAEQCIAAWPERVKWAEEQTADTSE